MTLLTGERGCGIDQFPDVGIHAVVRVVCGALIVVVARVVPGPGDRGLELAGRGRVPGRLVVPMPVSRCGADPLARMI